jgi:hypothetical protein
MTGFIARKAQTRGLARRATDLQIGDLQRLLHQMRLKRREALEGPSHDCVAGRIAGRRARPCPSFRAGKARRS